HSQNRTSPFFITVLCFTFITQKACYCGYCGFFFFAPKAAPKTAIFQVTAITEHLFCCLPGQFFFTGERILLNSCYFFGISQPIVQHFSVSCLDIAVDLCKELQVVPHHEFFKSGSVHPDMVFFPLKIFPIRIHATYVYSFEATLSSFTRSIS